MFVENETSTRKKNNMQLSQGHQPKVCNMGKVTCFEL